jgi:hypothetical protein
MMNHRGRSYLIAVVTFLVVQLAVTYSSGTDSGEAGQQTIEGLVRDISCPLQNKAATATKFNLQCARQCVEQGSPIIILSKDGDIYLPISDSMPDKSQRERLLPFVGKYVKATGKVFERAGSRAIAIKTITEMKNVHLITDAQ